ncbi:MAG TPA: 6-bladed beta-propeller [Terracidiphilus sp.]
MHAAAGMLASLQVRFIDVAFAINGDIYVPDGYGNSRVVKFDRDGNYIKSWGKYGTAPGEFNLPHTVAVDREGRVYVGDRENQRVVSK